MEQPKKSYRVLIVGPIYDHHLRRLIDKLKTENPFAIIDIFTLNGTKPLTDDINDKVRTWYYTYKQDKWSKHIYFKAAISYILRSKKILKHLAEKEKYDVVNVHFPLFFYSYIVKELKNLSPTLLISPWGSDVYRYKGISRNLVKHLYTSADKVCGIGNRFQKDVKRIFSIPDDKFVPLDIPYDSIDAIIDNKVSTEVAKEYFGLEDKYIVTCGYNATSAQQHERIIKEIIKVREQLPDNLFLLFPMTYSKVPSYINHIREVLEQSKLSYKIFEDYLSDKDLVYLRCSTDMFIHMQITDANASSVQEYILCDKKVINGSWVRYDELEQYCSIPYFIAETMDSLGETLVMAFHSPNRERKDRLIEFIESGGTKQMIKKWDVFFSSCANRSRDC